MRKTIIFCAFLFLAFTVHAEHKIGKKIDGKVIDSSGEVLKTQLSKKKYIILYYTASY